jgi:hypothetical protein
MNSRFEHRNQFGSGILHAVPRRAEPADRVSEIGPMIQIGQPLFEVAILKVALYLGGLQRLKMYCKFSGVIGFYGEPTLVAPRGRAIAAGMKDTIFH